MIIPGLPKVEYRNGYGAYEGVVAHSTATLKRLLLIFETMKQEHGVLHLYIMQQIGMKQFKLPPKYQAWGAYPATNKRFVHVELCETADYTKFKRDYDKYVKLLAKILRERRLSVEKNYGHIVM